MSSIRGPWLATAARLVLLATAASSAPPLFAAAYCPPFVSSRADGAMIGCTSSPSYYSPPARVGGRGDLTMKVSRGKSRRRKDNSLVSTNSRRVRSAGRVGTKRYVDPSKLFIGNLPYSADEDAVYDFIASHLGDGVTRMNVESVKIARDWRTGRSKGYGFVSFLEPVMASQAMNVVGGKDFMGRSVTLDQGRRRVDPATVWRKPREARADNADDTNEREGLDAADEAPDLSDVISLDGYEDEGGDDDMVLFLDDDDDDFEFDGVFEDVYRKELSDPGGDPEAEKLMNREERREAAKGRKKRKLPHKGFA